MRRPTSRLGALLLFACAACAPKATPPPPGTGTGGASAPGGTGGGGQSGTGGAPGGAAGIAGTGGGAGGGAGSGATGGATGGGATGGATGGGATGGGAAGGAGTSGGRGGGAAGAAGGTGGAIGTGGASGRGGAAGGGAGGASGQSGGGGQTAPVDQTAPGPKAAAPLLDNFDGLAVGNPTDLSLAVGPNHIVQVVNWSMAVYSKKGAMYATTGMSLRGPVTSNTPFAGAGGRCEARSGDAAADRGDVVVRYDQLAQRWVFLQPVFRSPYAMCYAVSDGADPLGTYHHYEFARPLFPDYPRLGIWPDGYYVGSSTGDDVVQKTICVADRMRMLAGQSATEQCVNKNDVNFLNPADVDGMTPPPAGAPNIVMAAGGTQLRSVFSDDGVYAFKYHVDWATPANSTFTGPTKITVARYTYLCNGQLSSCVTQPSTTQRLDSQGDKLMQRLAYRNFGDHQSIVVTHSVNGPAGGGALRWYEFRVNAAGDPVLYQQSSFAPDAMYRWMGSAAMDRLGNIVIGYSFGGAPNFPGQRFVGRAAADPLGTMSLKETVIIAGAASQTSTLRWQDYATTVLDPSDDTTFWYVGNYLKLGVATPATRIASVRVP